MVILVKRLVDRLGIYHEIHQEAADSQKIDYVAPAMLGMSVGHDAESGSWLQAGGTALLPQSGGQHKLSLDNREYLQLMAHGKFVRPPRIPTGAEGRKIPL